MEAWAYTPRQRRVIHEALDWGRVIRKEDRKKVRGSITRKTQRGEGVHENVVHGVKCCRGQEGGAGRRTLDLGDSSFVGMMALEARVWKVGRD